jgi:hypothetical protein
MRRLGITLDEPVHLVPYPIEYLYEQETTHTDEYVDCIYAEPYEDDRITD